MPHPVPAYHAAHDVVLVAAYAAGDAEGPELETATDLVATCADCAALHRDLRAIAAALPELPAPARTRDFRLTPGQAASLRPAGWRRLLVPFAGPRFAFAAPLGSGLAALGIVGILLAGTGLPLGGATAGAVPAEAERATSNGAGAESAPVAAAPSPAPVAAAPSPGDLVMAQGEPAASAAPDASVEPQFALSPADQPPPSAVACGHGGKGRQRIADRDRSRGLRGLRRGACGRPAAGPASVRGPFRNPHSLTPEPAGLSRRLGRDMPHPDPAPLDPVPADHAAHDAVLVAAYAAGDAEGLALETATALVAGCADCAALHHDLRAIAAALPELPAPARTRDFRLTPGQAASLRPAGWRRLLVPFAGPRFAFAAPLGSGLAALGIVGILLAGTGLPLGGATAGAVPAEAPLMGASSTADDGSANVAAASAAPSAEVRAPVAAPQGVAGVAPAASGEAAAGTDKNAAFGPDASTEPVAGAAADSSPGEAPETPGEAVRAVGARGPASEVPGNVALLGLAAGMLLVGVVLAGLRVLSRRIA